MGAGTTLSPDAMDLVTRAKATRRRTPTVRDPDVEGSSKRYRQVANL
ncbi:hypothetical protein SORBI_3010G222050 [Sorghum bicolor]|uniref:Uncharacterized protein n=1 Tax=Sorghum bicolor TaxID=4558 RepID=A0A1W0VUA7_SORBI|nr:hypothetical protein SORBI_3010G222050 [Sorghum bicolor]